MYCAVVLDVHSRRVADWSIYPSQAAALATNALGMAISNRSPLSDPVIHSHQGVRFTSWTFTRRGKECGLQPSTSSIGDCCDNAMINRFGACADGTVGPPTMVHPPRARTPTPQNRSRDSDPPGEHHHNPDAADCTAPSSSTAHQRARWTPQEAGALAVTCNAADESCDIPVPDSAGTPGRHDLHHAARCSAK
ncbi:DDE-type integrase/transposase/recombinase [Actinosynnema sp. NPDC091369]